jgi:secreted trypsin-like serine protease
MSRRRPHSDRPTAEDPEVIEAIARANEAAGDDDRAFIRYLNEQVGRTPRSKGLPRSLRLVHPDAPSKSFHIGNDPRYLKNARQLALRTQGGLRVIGGQRVPPREFVDCVAIGPENGWCCSGTLIGPNVVVTAGHCAECSSRVFFGNDVRRKGVLVDVKKRVRHPQYHRSANNDLTVLLLKESVNIPPRAIASARQIDKAPDGRAIGFGSTDPLGSTGYGLKRQVDVPIASSSCTGKLGGRTDAMSYGCDAKLEIVAGRPMLAKDACTGDSGGPFYILTDKDEWRLAGATSRATKSSVHTCGDGGIYVRLDKYLPWIRSIPGVKLA